jgi:hypothetical protein
MRHAEPSLQPGLRPAVTVASGWTRGPGPARPSERRASRRAARSVPWGVLRPCRRPCRRAAQACVSRRWPTGPGSGGGRLMKFELRCLKRIDRRPASNRAPARVEADSESDPSDPARRRTAGRAAACGPEPNGLAGSRSERLGCERRPP